MNFLISTLIWTACVLFIPVDGLSCPEESVMEPCVCTSKGLTCIGNLITQEVLDGAFENLRENNSILPYERIQMDDFYLWSTNLKELDLTPFLNSTFTANFNVYMNFELSVITGPGSSHYGSITVYGRLNMQENSFTDEGFSDTLKYFSPSPITLDLRKNLLRGPGEQGQGAEFLPGISQFDRLSELFLGDNNISVIESGMFSNHIYLEYLDISGDQDLSIGQNVFDFIGWDTNVVLEIRLSGRGLNDLSMNMQENGMLQFTRPISLSCYYNNFEYISAENFEMFLNATPLNKIDLYENPIICDQRMKWLHDQRELYENKVIDADCTNDPGYDVFTTSLII